MPYGFTLDVPINAEIYAQIREKLGDPAPEGLIAHVAVECEGGLRYVDVWETESQWKSFQDSRLLPTLVEVLAGYGITPDPSAVRREDLVVVDAWTGADRS